MNENRIKEKLAKGKRLSKLDAPKKIIDEEVRMSDEDFIVSKTDTKGFITYCNRIFVEMAAWNRFELIGANHNIIRHPDMPKIAFKLLWDLVQNGKEFFGFVKNLRKDGRYYWVFAYISPDYDLNGNIIGYTSFRKKPSRKGIEVLEPVYKELVEIEKVGGMNASYEKLKEILNASDEDFVEKYQKLVFDLQKNN